MGLLPGLPRFFCSSVSVDNNTRIHQQFGLSSRGGGQCRVKVLMN